MKDSRGSFHPWQSFAAPADSEDVACWNGEFSRDAAERDGRKEQEKGNI